MEKGGGDDDSGMIDTTSKSKRSFVFMGVWVEKD